MKSNTRHPSPPKCYPARVKSFSYFIYEGNARIHALTVQLKMCHYIFRHEFNIRAGYHDSQEGRDAGLPRDSAFFKHPRVLCLWGNEPFPSVQCTYTDHTDAWEDPALLRGERGHFGTSNHVRILNHHYSPTCFHTNANDNSLVRSAVLNSRAFVGLPVFSSSFAPKFYYVHQCQWVDCDTPYCALLSH